MTARLGLHAISGEPRLSFLATATATETGANFVKLGNLSRTHVTLSQAEHGTSVDCCTP